MKNWAEEEWLAKCTDYSLGYYSDESPSTPVSITEHSWKWRKARCSNKSLHMELEKKDSLRKKLKAVENAMRRREDPEEAERYRKKEREKKHKQCLERKKESKGGSFHRNSLLQWRGRWKTLSQNWEENIWNYLRKNQVRRGHLHLKSHLKIANSLLAKQFGIISRSIKWNGL